MDKARDRLIKSGIFRSSMSEAWRSASFKEMPLQTVAIPCMAFDAGILIYPAFKKLDDYSQLRWFVQAFGSFYYSRMGTRKRIWDNRLILPAETQIDDFQGKLMSGKFFTYRALVEDFKNATSRLVAIHLSNAFLANNIAIKDAANVDVKTWPCTESFACGKSYYSLKPLLSAYAPQIKGFGDALAEVAVDDCVNIYETSVKSELRALINAIA